MCAKIVNNAALFFLICLFACSFMSTYSLAADQPMKTRMQTLSAMPASEFDKEWMNEMISHHEGAIQMSEMAEKKSQIQQIKNAAEKIIKDQRKDQQKMTQWLKDWYNTSPKKEAQPPEMMSKMDKLKSASGAEFDREFLDAMIKHHEDGISMAKLATSQAKHPQLKGLAENDIETQSKEIEEFMNWQKLGMK